MNNHFDKQLELSIYYDIIYNRLYKPHRLRFLILTFLIIFYISIPGFHITSLEFTRVRFSGIMEQRFFQNLFMFYPAQNWVTYDEIPKNLKRCVLAMEDDAFSFHRGIDWESLRLAARVNVRRGRFVRGGSTITMQVAKNIYFTTSKNYFRKSKEILTAIRMEKEIPKEQTLEQYLNIIELGDRIFGVQTASKFYFKKDVMNLSLNEIARLVAIIPAPLRYTPLDKKRFVNHRASIALSRMYNSILPEER